MNGIVESLFRNVMEGSVPLPVILHGISGGVPMSLLPVCLKHNTAPSTTLITVWWGMVEQAFRIYSHHWSTNIPCPEPKAGWNPENYYTFFVVCHIVKLNACMQFIIIWSINRGAALNYQMYFQILSWIYNIDYIILLGSVCHQWNRQFLNPMNISPCKEVYDKHHIIHVYIYKFIIIKSMVYVRYVYVFPDVMETFGGIVLPVHTVDWELDRLCVCLCWDISVLDRLIV